MPTTTFTVEDHQLWLRRIQAAKQEQAKRHDAWTKALKLYSMQFWSEQGFAGNLTDTTIPVNYTTTFVLTKVASIYARNPKIFVRPRRLVRSVIGPGSFMGQLKKITRII